MTFDELDDFGELDSEASFYAPDEATEEAKVIIDSTIKKLGRCESLDKMLEVLSALPIKEGDFWEKCKFKEIEEGTDLEKHITLNRPFFREPTFRGGCILTLFVFLHAVTKKTIDFEKVVAITNKTFSIYDLPDEIQCWKVVNNFINIVRNIRKEKIYKRLQDVPLKYHLQALLEVGTLVILLERYAQKMLGEKEVYRNIERTIDNVDRLREKIQQQESEEKFKNQKEVLDQKLEYEVLRTGKRPKPMTKVEMEALEVKDYGLYFNVCTNEIFVTSEKGPRKIELDKKPKEILIFLIKNAGRMYDWLDLREEFFPDKKLPDGKEKPYGPEPIHKQMSVLTGAIQGKKEIFIKKSANVPLKDGRLAYYFNPKASYCLIKYAI